MCSKHVFDTVLRYPSVQQGTANGIDHFPYLAFVSLIFLQCLRISEQVRVKCFDWKTRTEQLEARLETGAKLLGKLARETSECRMFQVRAEYDLAVLR